MAFNLKREIWQWFLILAGSILVAVSFVLFLTPYQVVPGGVYGIGVVLNYLFPEFQVGTYGLLLDIPLLLVAFRLFGKTIGAKTVGASIIAPLIMNGLTFALGGTDPAVLLGGKIDLSNDILLACIFGGSILGIGIGLILKTHATSGGTDILAMALSKYGRISISRALLIVDSTVVIFGLVALNSWLLPLYSLVTIFVMTRVVDYIVNGGGGDKLLFILSDRNEQIKEFILRKMDRGGTYIHSAGMYTGNEKEMIFVVVSRREISQLRDQVRDADPEAFMIVVDASETLGEGFKTFENS